VANVVQPFAHSVTSKYPILFTWVTWIFGTLQIETVLNPCEQGELNLDFNVIKPICETLHGYQAQHG